MNKVELIGRLTKDVETRKFGKGKNEGSVARFTIAVRDGVDAEGETLSQFINCVAWNSNVNVLESYTKKGYLVGIVGRIVNNNYEDEDGEMHYSQEVSVSEVHLIQPKQEETEEKSKGKKYHR